MSPLFSPEKQEVIRYKQEAAMYKGLYAYSQRQAEAERRQRRQAEGECARLQRELAERQREAEAQGRVEKALREVCRQLADELKQAVEQLEAQRRLNTWHTGKWYGQSSEKGAGGLPPSPTPEESPPQRPPRRPQDAPRRPRGFPHGHAGHGRRLPEDLPVDARVITLPESACRCPQCGQPYEAFGATEDSSQIAIEYVSVKRIVWRRLKYRATCACEQRPVLRTAPAAPKVLPKGQLTAESLRGLLVNKLVYNLPLHRMLAQLADHGCRLAAGTVLGAFRRLVPLLLPLWEACRVRCVASSLWHIDETSWRVFVAHDGKTNYRWWLWAFVGQEAVFYLIDPSRSGVVPYNVLGPGACGVVMTDRYPGYNRLPATVQRAYCWAHVRRDFRKLLDGPCYAWAAGYVRAIGRLYQAHRRRQLAADAAAFAAAHELLRAAFDRVMLSAVKDLLNPSLPQQPRAVLESLDRHWEGLRLTLEQPLAPLDNNAAERSLRTPVVGRKNYYGSGAYWSAQLAAAMWSLAATCRLHQVKLQEYLDAYLHACAHHGAQAPAELAGLLPRDFQPALRAEKGDGRHAEADVTHDVSILRTAVHGGRARDDPEHAGAIAGDLALPVVA
jgi:transposase